MKNIEIRKAQNAEFDVIARLIVDQNKNPATHCIQSDTGADYDGVRQEISNLAARSEVCFVAAFQANQLVGTLGCELDEEMGRGWVRGPFVLAADDDWDKLAAALLQELLSILPPAIRCLDSFLDIANEQGNRFYLSNGFQQLRLVHVYLALPPEKPFILSPSCPTLPPVYRQEFVALHNTIFSQTYATGERILDKLDDNHQVFVFIEGDALLGYLYAVIDEEAQEGLVDFLGVREGASGQGIGWQLLQTALHWFFVVKKMPQAGLVVNDDLTNARSLYEKVGFMLKYTGVHTRKSW